MAESAENGTLLPGRLQAFYFSVSELINGIIGLHSGIQVGTDAHRIRTLHVVSTDRRYTSLRARMSGYSRESARRCWRASKRVLSCDGHGTPTPWWCANWLKLDAGRGVFVLSRISLWLVVGSQIGAPSGRVSLLPPSTISLISKPW